jgi:alkylhydroperoxidase family enzyme
MKRKPSSLTADAFLEAVLDAHGLEDGVLTALLIKPKALHGFLEKNPDLRQAALSELEEREFDTFDIQFGWLRPSQKLQPQTEEDANWARYKALLEEEPRLEALESLENAKARTQDLVSQLQAAKRAKLEAKKVNRVQVWDD